MPKISVVMPVYNGEAYLPEAIDSVIAQTFTDWEFIIVNEFGSNRAATAILKEYEAREPRIRVIQNQKRLGIAESLNVGLRAATGEFIARMDGDDISLPERFAKQAAYLDMNPEIAACGTRVEVFGDTDMVWDQETNPRQISSDILFYSPCVHPTIMVRRSFLSENQISYNATYSASEDYDLFAQICKKGMISNLGEILFRYRLLSRNATFRNNDAGVSIYSQVMERQFQALGLNFTNKQLDLLSPHKCLKGLRGNEVLEKICELDLLLKDIYLACCQSKSCPRENLAKTLHKRFRDAYDSVSWACRDFDQSKVDEIYKHSIFANELFGVGYPAPVGMKEPVVSVLLPAYNSEKYIIDTVDSILRQTFTAFELIIVNEFGSNDRTVAFVETFDDPRIRLIQNTERLGLAASLNKGIDLAYGKYIARIDADDTCHPERFAKQVAFLDSHEDYGVCGSWQHHWGFNTEWVHRPPVEHDELKASFIYRCELCHSTLMLRRSSFVNNNLYYDPTCAAEDYELWTRAVQKFKFGNLPEVLGEYRVGDDNITAQKLQRLSAESGELAARNIRDYLGVDVPESHIPFMSNWINEFNNVEDLNIRREHLKVEENILRGMWNNNEKKHVYERKHLLTIINIRWRWAINDWVFGTPLGRVRTIGELFGDEPEHKPEYEAEHESAGESENKNSCEPVRAVNVDMVREVAIARQKNNDATVIGYFKKLVKKILYPFYKPFKHRVCDRFDQLRQQLWDLDGHLKDAKYETKDYIGQLRQQLWDLDGHLKDAKCETKDYIGQLRQQLWDMDGHLKDAKSETNDYIHKLETMFIQQEEKLRSLERQCSIAADAIMQVDELLIQMAESRIPSLEQLIQTADERIAETEQRIARTIDSCILSAEQRLADRIGAAEEAVNKVTDARLWKAEQLINQTIDARIWKAEQQINEITDARIWKAEQQLAERVGAAEESVNKTMDARVWKAEKTINQTTDTRIWKAEMNLNVSDKKLEEIHRHIDVTYRDIMIMLENSSGYLSAKKIRLETEYPVAYESLDHLYPHGTIRDNTRYPRFIEKCEQLLAPKKELAFLDLGCSGGGMVLDAALRGHLSIGLEGSNCSKIAQRAEWRLLKDNLKTCDISKPFVLKNESGKIQKFDVISAWEVLEHISEADLPQLFENIANHMSDNGYFIGSIANWDDIDPETGVNWHVTVHGYDWWVRQFEKAGFIVCTDKIETVDLARGGYNPPRCYEEPYPEVNTDTSFHIVVRKGD